MPRPLRPGDAATVQLAESALADLRSARDKLSRIGAVKAVDRTRAAISSTMGAVRHADRRREASRVS